MSPISGVGSTPGQNAAQSVSALTGGTVPNEEMFLQLLVTQIKNQDPLNPADGTQFVSQLAQFSELEQVIAIRQDLDGVAAAAPTNTANQV